MKYLIILMLIGISLNACSQNQPNEKKGLFYFYWGYNRSYFSKTNLHFNGPNYDFTLYDIRAKDKPSKLDWDYINPTKFTIPQYNYRFGYFITDGISISGGLDHMKYVVTQNQLTKISGVITEVASTEYAGSYLNQPIELKEDLLKFEHTDGFNLMSIDLEYLLNFKNKNYSRNKLSFNMNFGLGGIWIVTKTNVKVFGDGLDNDFHIAGFTLVGKLGPRIEYKNKFFILGEIKGGYASLPSVLIKNAEPEIGDHNLTFIEYYFAIGSYFRLFKKKPMDRILGDN